MTKKKNNAISPTRTENYPEWYQQVVKSAELAETSAVRGCMVIKPWGYALWENIQKFLDSKLKETGHVNAYFPLFIPKSYLEKEGMQKLLFQRILLKIYKTNWKPRPNRMNLKNIRISAKRKRTVWTVC